jgi:hypothetical protein
MVAFPIHERCLKPQKKFLQIRKFKEPSSGPGPALHRVNSYMYLHNSISKRITFGDELANACNDRGDVCLVRHGCVWAENQSPIVCSKADGYAKADTGSLRGAAELR